MYGKTKIGALPAWVFEKQFPIVFRFWYVFLLLVDLPLLAGLTTKFPSPCGISAKLSLPELSDCFLQMHITC